MRAVNLLPSDLRGADKSPVVVDSAAKDSGGSGALFLLGALGLSVAAVAAYTVTGNAIKQHEADLAELETRSAAVTAEVARLKPYADFATMATERIATVHDLASQRFDWEGSLRDLSYAMPADVSVKQLNASVTGSGTGGGSALRGAIQAPAIEINGCAGDQPSVARMMARMRAVNGVTRVSLASTMKTESADSAPADSAVGGAEVTGCEGTGKSDPPDFSVVAFFENSTVPSAAGAVPPAAAGGTGAAPATAPGTTATETATEAATTPPSDGTTVPTSTESE